LFGTVASGNLVNLQPLQVGKMKQNEKFPKFGVGRDHVVARALCRRTPKQPFWQQITDQLMKRTETYTTPTQKRQKITWTKTSMARGG